MPVTEQTGLFLNYYLFSTQVSGSGPLVPWFYIVYAFLGSIFNLCDIQHCVIMNSVIKRLHVLGIESEGGNNLNL